MVAARQRAGTIIPGCSIRIVRIVLLGAQVPGLLFMGISSILGCFSKTRLLICSGVIVLFTRTTPILVRA